MIGSIDQFIPTVPIGLLLLVLIGFVVLVLRPAPLSVANSSPRVDHTRWIMLVLAVVPLLCALGALEHRTDSWGHPSRPMHALALFLIAFLWTIQALFTAPDARRIFKGLFPISVIAVVLLAWFALGPG